MIPTQVREAIVRLFHDDGRTYADIARLLSVGEATVSRVLRRHRETGSVQPKPRGGGNFSPLTGKVLTLLEKIVEEMPDATVKELTVVLRKRSGVETSRSSVQRALQRMGFSLKKSPSSPRRGTPRKTRSAVGSSASS